VNDDLGMLRIAGVSHYQEALERCAPGQAVRLVHEPDNPHDPMALRVISLLGETIGYVPKGSWVHNVIHQRGRGVTAVIASMGYSRACLMGATLSAVVCDDEPAIRSYYPDREAPEPPKGGFRYWVRSPSDVAQLVAARTQRASPTPIQHPPYPQR
jgi:hypothetical protein